MKRLYFLAPPDPSQADGDPDVAFFSTNHPDPNKSQNQTNEQVFLSFAALAIMVMPVAAKEFKLPKEKRSPFSP